MFKHFLYVIACLVFTRTVKGGAVYLGSDHHFHYAVSK